MSRGESAGDQRCLTDPRSRGCFWRLWSWSAPGLSHRACRTGPVAPGLFWGSATGCWFAARVRRLPISPGALALVTADAEKGVFGRLDV
jgi:hypothetical protein